jgi:hypothetical protein
MRASWRSKLLTAYAHRKKVFEQERYLPKGKFIRSLVIVLFGMGFTLIGIGLTCRGILQYEENFLWLCCGGPLLFLFGLLILGAVWFSERSQTRNKSRRVPLHPFRGGPKQKDIYPELRESWMKGLLGTLEKEVPDYPDYLAKDEKDHGAQGERSFIQSLDEIFDDRYYLMARLMQRPREDVDVILIGPKGIWVFEVKHWSGEIYWDDQSWHRVQTYFERGGLEVTTQPDVGEPPDQQWIRAAAQVSRTLQSHATEILDKYPNLEKVRGGIVFTKEDAVLKIQPGRSVYWGKLNFWLKTLNKVEPKVNLDTRSTLQLVEIFLNRHQQLTNGSQHRSMQDYAHNIVLDADAKLRDWAKT